MIQEIVHALIQRVLHDKIILGLLIIGIAAVFMSGLNSSDDNHSSAKSAADTQKDSNAQSQSTSATLEPNLATDFVKWWLGLAMDYSSHTAIQSHQQAFAWMDPGAIAPFQSSFWTKEIATGINDGRIVAAFQPSSVTAQALNPDGSVVVAVAGSYVLQANGQPMPFQVKADFLVRREKEGLRIAGVYNELANSPSQSVN